MTTGDSDAAPTSTPLTPRIESATAWGNAPGNRSHPPVLAPRDRCDHRSGLATKIACAPNPMMAEHRFFSDLEAVDAAEMEQEHLVLSGPGDVGPTFQRADDPA